MTDQTPEPKFLPGTFYGHASTPKLTKDQEQQVVELLATGATMAKICEEVGVSYGRVRQVKEKRKAAEAVAMFQATKDTPKRLESIQSTLTALLTLTQQLVSELSGVRAELRKAQTALFRRQLELKHARENRRELARQLKELKALYWNKTGGTYP